MKPQILPETTTVLDYAIAATAAADARVAEIRDSGICSAPACGRSKPRGATLCQKCRASLPPELRERFAAAGHPTVFWGMLREVFMYLEAAAKRQKQRRAS